MHITSKEVNENGVHILTSVIEGDGAVAMASEKAKLDAKVISLARTDSGGIQVQLAVSVTEPTPEVQAAPVAPPSPEEEAAAYMQSKGLNARAAKAAVEKFGAANIFCKRLAERDAELDALLSPKS